MAQPTNTDADFQAWITSLSDPQIAGPLAKQVAGIQDGVSEGLPVYDYINKNCKVPFVGGSNVEWTISTALPSGSNYKGLKTVTAETGPTLAELSLPRAFYQIGATYTRTDFITNRGPDAKIKLVSKKLQEMRLGAGQQIAKQLLGDGTSDSDGNALDADGYQPYIGLANMFPSTTTSGTYGGQTRSATTRWLNPNSLSGGAGVASIELAIIDQAITKATHAGKAPDVGFLCHAAFRRLRALARAEGYLPNEEMMQLGYPDNIKYGPVTFVSSPEMSISSDGGLMDADIKAIYIINSSSIEFAIDPQEDMKLEGMMELPKQHAYIQYMYQNGQIYCINPRLNTKVYWT